MKIAGGVVALIGGVFGVLAAIFTLAFGGVASAFGTEQAGTVVALGGGGLFFSFAVIVAGAVVFARPLGAGIAVVVCSLAGMVLGGTVVAVAMVLSLVGGILAIIAGRSQPTVTAPAANTAAAPSGAERKTLLWGGAGAVALVALVAIAIVSKAPPKPATDPLQALVSATPSNLRPDGELAQLFAFGSKNTDLQRDNTLKTITGQIVEWHLPVYEVKQTRDGYKIQTQSGSALLGPASAVGTFIHITPRNDDERHLIEQLKTGDMVGFRGVVAGSTIRNLEIRPAILVTAASASAPPPAPAQTVGLSIAPAPNPVGPSTETPPASLPTGPTTAAPAASSIEEAAVETSGPCKGLDLAVTGSQAECTDRKLKSADASLNAAYKESMSRLTEPQRVGLRDSQRAWLKESKSKCEHAGDEVKGGTMEPMMIADCQLQLTEERARYLTTYTPPASPDAMHPAAITSNKAQPRAPQDNGVIQAAESMVRDGEACMQSKNYSCAVTNARNALRLAPSNQQAAQLRDRAQQAQKNALDNIKLD